jgi:putative membrane protein
MYVILVVAAVLEFVNAVIRPVIGFLTLPINILTLGLFSLVLNGCIFYGLTYVVPGFHVSSVTAAIIGAVVVSILNWILEKIL